MTSKKPQAMHPIGKDFSTKLQLPSPRGIIIPPHVVKKLTKTKQLANIKYEPLAALIEQENQSKAQIKEKLIKILNDCDDEPEYTTRPFSKSPILFLESKEKGFLPSIGSPSSKVYSMTPKASRSNAPKPGSFDEHYKQILKPTYPRTINLTPQQEYYQNGPTVGSKSQSPRLLNHNLTPSNLKKSIYASKKSHNNSTDLNGSDFSESEELNIGRRASHNVYYQRENSPLLDIFNADPRAILETAVGTDVAQKIIMPEELTSRVSKDLSSARRESPEIIKFLESYNKVVQPKYMENKGSMCASELWGAHQKNYYYHKMKGMVPVVSRVGDENSSGIYKGGRVSQAKLIHDKASTQLKLSKSDERDLLEASQKSKKFHEGIANRKKLSKFEHFFV